MKRIIKLKTSGLIAMIGFLIFSLSSCVVLLEPGRHGKPGNNGKHKGWYKAMGNPHGQLSATPWEPIENTILNPN